MKRNCYDVCIYGGGATAAGAAIESVRNGLSVVLVTPNGFVCGEAANAFFGELPTGISATADDLAAELEKAGAYKAPYADVCAMQLRLLQALKPADILYYARPAGFVRRDNRIAGFICATKNGLESLCAKCFLDLSDNLDFIRLIQPDACLADTAAESLFILNMELDKPCEPEKLPRFENIALGGSLWDTELVVKIKNGTRQSVLPVLKKIRLCNDVLKDAIVTRASNSPVSLSRCVLGRELDDCNLFASKTVEKFTFAEHSRLIPIRMAAGEKVVREILPQLPQMPNNEIRETDVSVVLPAESEECDILICGGGTAGTFAAIAAGRSGAKTILWEGLDYLGGIGTGGAIPGYYYGTPGGLQTEIDAKVTECTRLLNGRHAMSAQEESVRFHPLAKMIVLEDEVRKAGVKIEYGKTMFSVKTTEIQPPALPVKSGTPQPPLMHRVDRAEGISEGGLSACTAKVFIDATGDGDVAVAAGAKYTAGRDPDAIQHIYSIPAMFLTENEEKNDKGEVVKQDFRLWTFNIDAGYADACDPWDVSRARRVGLLGFDRPKYGKNHRIQSFSTVLGARASRQIVGDYKLGLADQICASKFNDVIAYSASHYDNHALDYENESVAAMLWSWALDNHNAPIGCEIPYSTMLPLGVENLIVACRAISLDYDATLQFRMQRDMQRIGEAAGYAAAVAVQDGTSPRYIDIVKVQNRLFETKALSHPETNFHSDEWKPEGFYPARRLFELTPAGYKLAQNLLPGGVQEESDLKAQLASDDDGEKYAAALKLAAGANNPEANKLVPKCVESRCETLNAGWWCCRTPLWKIAIAVCGTNKLTEAKGIIEGILVDEKCVQDQQVLILAIRALGEIGDADSAAAIENLLRRSDLPHTQEFPYWCSEQTVVDDSSWKLELAAYESLCKLGVKSAKYLDKYLTDERGYVRQAAQRVKMRTDAVAKQ